MTNPISASTHTPGSWEEDGQFILAPDPRRIHPDIYLAEIVQDDKEGRFASAQQQQANACLMAAAPDLLTALEYLLEQTVNMDLTYGVILTEGEEEARAKALAALAKATHQ